MEGPKEGGERERIRKEKLYYIVYCNQLEQNITLL